MLVSAGQARQWLFYYWRCQFSLLELDVVHNWWVMAPNTHCSRFPISHLCILAHISLKVQAVYGCFACQMTTLLSETFLVFFIVAWEIHWRATGPRHVSVVLWYNIVCIYCKPIQISLFGAQLHVITQLMYLMTAYYIPNGGFTANSTSFYKDKVA